MYGRGGELRYFIGFAAVIVLLIFAITLILHHGSSNKVPVTQKPLTSYINDPNAAVKETLVGPINAQSQHDEIQITVTNANTTFELEQGYDGNAVKTKLYPMDSASFGEFLYALDRAGFTHGNTASDLKDDRGYCPTGTRYIFEVMENGSDVERFWSSSCGSPKSFKGNTGLVLDLFQAQVPDYDTLTANSDFATSLF